MSRGIYQDYNIKIPAGGQRQFNVTGSFVHAYSLDGILSIMFDNDGNSTVFAEGLQYHDHEFKGFELINNSGAEITGKIVVGQGSLKDSRLSVAGTLEIQNAAGDILDVKGKKASSVLSSPSQTIVNGNPAIELTAVNSNRVSLVLRNLSPAYPVWVGDANVDASLSRGFPIFPMESFTLGNESGGFTGSLYASAGDGGSVNISILEVIE